MEFGRGTLIMHAFWWVLWWLCVLYCVHMCLFVGVWIWVLWLLFCWLGFVRVDLIWSDQSCLPNWNVRGPILRTLFFAQRNGTGQGILVPWSTSGHGILLVLFPNSVVPSLISCQDVIRAESKLYSQKRILLSRSNFPNFKFTTPV